MHARYLRNSCLANRFQVLPVLDLLRGEVVRGVSGQRNTYRPIESRIAASASPSDVAQAMRGLGLTRAYVADLDAIQSGPLQTEAIMACREAKLKIWLDAGFRRPEDVASVIQQLDVERVILGLESLSRRDQLPEMIRATGDSHAVFSLDLFEGRPWNESPDFRDTDPLELAAWALDLGIRTIIVLDVAAVGRDTGVRTRTLCQQIRQMSPEVTVITGGGVRDACDVERIEAWGCGGVLVASALHDGRLTKEMLQRWTS